MNVLANHISLKLFHQRNLRWVPVSMWLRVSADLCPPPSPKFNPSMIARIRMATPSIINPTFGWKQSQEIDMQIKNRGIATMMAAIKIIHPTTLDRKPPTRGMYPRMLVIGEKNR